MKTTKLAAAAALLSLLTLGSAWAQDAASPDLRQPLSVQRTAFQYDSNTYYAAEDGAGSSPSDKPANGGQTPPADIGGAAGGCDACNGCSSGERSCRWCRCGKLPDPWTLPQPCALACRDIKIAGWLSGGVYGNAFGDASNGPLSLNSVGDGFTANQLWIYAEKKVDTQGCGTDWGFRTDYVFGTDGPDTQTIGDRSWDWGWNTGRDYGSAIPQLYGEFGFNDWTLKAGHFYTPMGYEVVPAPGNFFYSHSYMFGYAEPFTHTGFLLTRKVNDKVSVFGGWVDGWDAGFGNYNGGSNFIGGTNITFSEKSSLSWVICTGRWGDGRAPYVNGAALGNVGEVFHSCLVFTRKIGDNWTYVLQNDIANNWARPGGNDAQWYGIAQYLLYKINDCWSVGGRLEWFRDDDGVRVIDGNAGNYWEATLGLNYQAARELHVPARTPLRLVRRQRGPRGRPFNGGLDIDQVSAGFDMIFTY